MGSGFKTFSAGSVLTASDTNNYLMEQSVMYFATTAARDAAITSAEDGMVCYVGSNDSSEGLYTYNGTSWRKGPGWNAPWGVMTYGVTSTTQVLTSSTTKTTIKSSSSFTAVANRVYEVSVHGEYYGNTSGDVFNLYVEDDQNNIKYQSVISTDVEYAVVFGCTLAAGTRTMSLKLQRSDGSGRAGTNGTTGLYWVIKDIGPDGAPS